MPREKKAEPWEELSAVIKIKVKRRASLSILRSDHSSQTVIFSSPHRFRSHHGNCHQRAPHHLLFIAAALQFLSKTTNFFGALWARYPASATSGYNFTMETRRFNSSDVFINKCLTMFRQVHVNSFYSLLPHRISSTWNEIIILHQPRKG